MPNSSIPAPLATFIREHRVRFTVTPERVICDEEPIQVGFDVRLFAWHGHEIHDLQGCAACAELEHNLQQVAELSIRGDASPTEIEIAPDYAMLYDSHDSPGTDDVALDIRLLRRGGDDQPVGTAEEKYLKQVRARLKDLGVREC